MHRIDFLLLFHRTKFLQDFEIISYTFLLPVQISSHQTLWRPFEWVPLPGTAAPCTRVWLAPLGRNIRCSIQHGIHYLSNFDLFFRNSKHQPIFFCRILICSESPCRRLSVSWMFQGLKVLLKRVTIILRLIHK